MDRGIPQKKILIVESVSFVRSSLKQILLDNHYEVAGEAANGKEAFEKYKELKPNVVLIDITTPEVSGLQVTKEILAFNSQAKIIVTTSPKETQTTRAALEAGAWGYIEKPFFEDSILLALKKTFRVRPTSKARILIAEDGPQAKFILNEIVLTEGYDVVGVVDNGIELIKKNKELRPDLIFITIKIPEASILQAVKKILEFDSSTKIILITAPTDKQYAAAPLKAGAHDYIVKPIISKQVVATIKKVLSKNKNSNGSSATT
ncbi:response regulator [Candidatus Auribacterota bacterium]